MENDKNFHQNHIDICESIENMNIIYLFEILTHNGVVINLNSSELDIFLNERTYYHYSCLKLEKGEFNDSAENYIILNGIFSDKAISKNTDLTGCQINIYDYNNKLKTLIVSYFITEFEKNDLDFIIKCEPETIKYNQSIILLYSKTCRANFGDEKCGINLDKIKKSYKVKSIVKNIISIVNMDCSNGYYNSGYVFFKTDLKADIKLSIISHYNEKIEVFGNIPQEFLEEKKVELISSCDKNFITCCNKFNNAVNFRGEPTISEHNFLKNNAK